MAADPDYRKTIEPTGTDIYYASSKEFGDFIQSEVSRFGAILNQSGTKLQ